MKAIVSFISSRCANVRFLEKVQNAKQPVNLAKRLGEAFRAHGIAVGEALNSSIIRCIDTGKLTFFRATSVLLVRYWNVQPNRALGVHASTQCAGGQMFKPIIRMTAATFVVGAVAFAITIAPAAHVRAGNSYVAKHAPPLPSTKIDRLRVPVKGAACSLHGWPSFEPKCQFDMRETADEARTVRVIALR